MSLTRATPDSRLVTVLVDKIDGVIQYTPKRFGDDRGYFTETYNRRTSAELGIDADFVQDNESLSAQPGTVRGLHFQVAPSAQGKLIRCTRGALIDVAVDIRHSSATFGDHVAVRLDPASGTQLWIPPGFAHGFCTLEPDTMISYKVSGGFYDPACDRALLWCDPALGIDWPIAPDRATVSDKDREAPSLQALGDTSQFFG